VPSPLPATYHQWASVTMNNEQSQLLEMCNGIILQAANPLNTVPAGQRVVTSWCCVQPSRQSITSLPTG